MPTYYFDIKDGVAIGERTGLEFATTGGAIEELARRLRRDARISDRSFSIVVIDGSDARRTASRRHQTRSHFSVFD
jgi:hypothetical protein